MSLLQDLTRMATQAPGGASALAILALDSDSSSFILVTGPVLAGKDAKVRAVVSHAFVTLLEQMGEEKGEERGGQ